MVVKCPSCGQQVRGDPGQSGPCPKCGTRFKFPDGDSQIGEPVTCPHCGQRQTYRNGRCISCGKALKNTVSENTTDKGGADGRAKRPAKYWKVFLIVVALLVTATVAGVILLQGVLQNKEYYKDYPSVPDFGTFAGIDSLGEYTLNGGKGYVYSLIDMANAIDDHPNLLSDYHDLLLDCGFTYSNMAEEGGHTVIWYIKDEITVGTGPINDYEYAIIIGDI